jgi:tetratricopeptide (TPR) repeat protein
MASSLEIKSEINRIKAKLSASADKDIKEALQFRLDALEKELAQVLDAEEKEQVEEIVKVESANPTNSGQLEKDIRSAHLHIVAGRKQEAKTLLEKLSAESPNNAEVLELRADLLIINKNFEEATKLLKTARKLSPENKVIERKLAEAALKSTSFGSLEDQLRAAESDLPILGEGDITATATAATVLSLILPGSGHIVIRKMTKGMTYMITWLLLMGYLLWEGTIFKGLVGFIAGRDTNFSMGPIFCAFIAVGIHLIAIMECAAISKRTGPRIIVEKPKPPVDLPFE